MVVVGAVVVVVVGVGFAVVVVVGAGFAVVVVVGAGFAVVVVVCAGGAPEDPDDDVVVKGGVVGVTVVVGVTDVVGVTVVVGAVVPLDLFRRLRSTRDLVDFFFEFVLVKTAPACDQTVSEWDASMPLTDWWVNVATPAELRYNTVVPAESCFAAVDADASMLTIAKKTHEAVTSVTSF